MADEKKPRLCAAHASCLLDSCLLSDGLVEHSLLVRRRAEAACKSLLSMWVVSFLHALSPVLRSIAPGEQPASLACRAWPEPQHRATEVNFFLTSCSSIATPLSTVLRGLGPRSGRVRDRSSYPEPAATLAELRSDRPVVRSRDAAPHAEAPPKLLNLLLGHDDGSAAREHAPGQSVRYRSRYAFIPAATDDQGAHKRTITHRFSFGRVQP